MTAAEGHDAKNVLAELKRLGKKKVIDEMARYGIPSGNAVGVSVGELKKLAKEIGKDHALALGLWESGVYEARMLAAFVGESEKLTAKQMTDWTRDFDSWAICDHCCFHLFDRSPHAWKKLATFTRSKSEFVKRCGFALIWALSLHDKEAPEEQFLACLPLIEKGATDERDLVKKSVDMALRALGRRNRKLNAAARATAAGLAKSADKNAAWIGRKSLRELEKTQIRG